MEVIGAIDGLGWRGLELGEGDTESGVTFVEGVGIFLGVGDFCF